MFRAGILSIIRSLVLYTYCCVYSTRLLMMDKKTCPKHVEFYSKSEFEKLVYLVCFFVGIRHDARSSKCQIRRDVVMLIWFSTWHCHNSVVTVVMSKWFSMNFATRKHRRGCWVSFNVRNVLCVSIQINHQPDATIFQFIILSFIYSSTCFGSSPAHHEELNDCSSSLWFYLCIVVIAVLCLWSGR